MSWPEACAAAPQPQPRGQTPSWVAAQMQTPARLLLEALWLVHCHLHVSGSLHTWVPQQLLPGGVGINAAGLPCPHSPAHAPLLPCQYSLMYGWLWLVPMEIAAEK